MKKYLILAVLILSAYGLVAQTGSVRGFVFDKTTGEPVIFANIQIDKTTIGTATDVNGYFVLSKLKAGNYTLKIGTIGYETLEDAIVVEKNKVISVNIDLEP